MGVVCMFDMLTNLTEKKFKVNLFFENSLNCIQRAYACGDF